MNYFTVPKKEIMIQWTPTKLLMKTQVMITQLIPVQNLATMMRLMFLMPDSGITHTAILMFSLKMVSQFFTLIS